MFAHRLIALALLSSTLFHAAAKDVLDDVTFDVVTRELEADSVADLVDIDDADARRLSDNTTSTTTMTTTSPQAETVSGNLKFGGMSDTQADDFIASATILGSIQDAIIAKAGVQGLERAAIAVTRTKVTGRRLQEVEPRGLQGTTSVDAAYVITLPSGVTASSVTTTLSAVTSEEFKTAFLAALTVADATLATTYANISVVAIVGVTTTTTVTTTVAPEVDGATKMALTSSALALAAAWLTSAQL